MGEAYTCSIKNSSNEVDPKVNSKEAIASNIHFQQRQVSVATQVTTSKNTLHGVYVTSSIAVGKIRYYLILLLIM